MTGAQEPLPADRAAPRRIEVPYRVRFDESTPAGTLRTSSLLRYAQDIAWIHSERLGFDRSWYLARGLAWLVRGVELEVSEPIRMGEDLLVSTEVTGFRKVSARRRSEFRHPDGGLAAVATIDWAMTDERGRPVRVPNEFPTLFGALPETFLPTRVAVEATPPDAVTLPFRVRPQDVDPMDHVNNAVYVDYLEEAILAQAGEALVAALPRQYQLEYLFPADRGADLVSAVWPADGGLRYRLTSAGGTDLLRARVEAS